MPLRQALTRLVPWPPAGSHSQGRSGRPSGDRRRSAAIGDRQAQPRSRALALSSSSGVRKRASAAGRDRGATRASSWPRSRDRRRLGVGVFVCLGPIAARRTWRTPTAQSPHHDITARRRVLGLSVRRRVSTAAGPLLVHCSFEAAGRGVARSRPLVTETRWAWLRSFNGQSSGRTSPHGRRSRGPRERGAHLAPPVAGLPWTRARPLRFSWKGSSERTASGGTGPDRSPRRCLVGIHQVVQRRRLAASHLQGPASLTAQLDHLLSLVAQAYPPAPARGCTPAFAQRARQP